MAENLLKKIKTYQGNFCELEGLFSVKQ